MEYIYLIIISLFLAQTLKFLFRYFSHTTDSKNLFWVFVWATGAPSAHATVLTSSLVLLYKDIGRSPLLIFLSLVTIIFLYNLVANRQRELIRQSNQKVLDISGHSLFDVMSGIILGLTIGIIFIRLWY